MRKPLALFCILLYLLMAGCENIHIDWQEVFTSRHDETEAPQPEGNYILAAGRGAEQPLPQGMKRFMGPRSPGR